jgi:DNA-binding response OmpR family regulator
MSVHLPVLLFEPDAAVRASLQFSLELQGFSVEQHSGGETDVTGGGCLVIDERLDGRDGLALLARLRERGCTAPAIILSTNPTRSTRQRTLEAGALLVEKPLLGDALTQALHAILDGRKAAGEDVQCGRESGASSREKAASPIASTSPCSQARARITTARSESYVK